VTQSIPSSKPGFTQTPQHNIIVRLSHYDVVPPLPPFPSYLDHGNQV
jgi:hypothetical protein